MPIKGVQEKAAVNGQFVLKISIRFKMTEKERCKRMG